MDAIITRRVNPSAPTPTPGVWVRPSDWLELPTLEAGDQKLVGLHAVFHGANFVAFTVSGNYHVDWGDGLEEDFVGGAPAYHEYNYIAYDSGGVTLSSRGYKQVIITITPQAGQNLTSINLRTAHNQSGLPASRALGWLDLSISAAALTTLSIGANSTSPAFRYLEKASIIDSGNVTTFAGLFELCTALQLHLVSFLPTCENNFSLYPYCTRPLLPMFPRIKSPTFKC
jgi:hypothetical protein